jgi:hypothetical protein
MAGGDVLISVRTSRPALLVAATHLFLTPKLITRPLALNSFVCKTKPKPKPPRPCGAEMASSQPLPRNTPASRPTTEDAIHLFEAIQATFPSETLGADRWYLVAVGSASCYFWVP